MQHFSYRPLGVCSQMIDFDIDNGKIMNVEFLGGCSGNLQGIGRLVQGMPVEEVIDRLEGIKCGFKQTSCPDQLCYAIRKAQEEMKQN